jgi:acetyl-CoA C-acetyltransferase
VNPKFADAIARTEDAAANGADASVDPRTLELLPDTYMPMGQTAENVARLKNVTR